MRLDVFLVFFQVLHLLMLLLATLGFFELIRHNQLLALFALYHCQATITFQLLIGVNDGRYVSFGRACHSRGTTTLSLVLMLHH